MSISVTIDMTDPLNWGPVTEQENRAIGAEVARLVQRHLRVRDSTHAHQYPDGGRRSHFWRAAAQAVSFTTNTEGISVAVAHQGARLRYAGAPDGIGPVNAGALAIPACAEAYGRTPKEFGLMLDLVVFKKKNRAALIDTIAHHVNHEYKIMFWLVKRTKPIKGDPTVLPPQNVVLGLALMRLRAFRERRRSNG